MYPSFYISGIIGANKTSISHDVKSINKLTNYMYISDAALIKRRKCTNHKLQVLKDYISNLRAKSEENINVISKSSNAKKILWQPMVDLTLNVQTCLT